MKSVAMIFIAFASHFSAYAQEDLKVDLLSRKKFAWLTQKKLDSLAEMLDERLMYVHSNGWIQTKKEMIDDLKTGKLNYISIEVKSNKVRVYNNTAIINGTGSFQVTMDGKPLTIELNYTEVYVKEKSRWLLASRHANRLQ